MSIYDKATLVQIPSGYKASGAKLYSVLPANGDGDFTVSADADATRVNSDGLIESTAANQARLSRNFIDGVVQPDPFLLLEPTRTNYLTNSNDASLWGVTQSNGTVTTTQNYSTAPNGSNEATRLEASVSGSGYALLSKSTTSFFGNYAATVYLKSTNGSSQEVCIYGRNTGNQVVTVTSEWQRFELNGSSTSGQSNFLNLGVNAGFTGEDNPIDILVWGGQIEAGTYATSLIPTSGSSVTRTVDYASGAGNSDTFNDSEGTLFIDAAALGNDGTYRIINISDGTLSNRVVIQLGDNNNLILSDIVSGGSTEASISTTSYNFTNYNKIAVRYKQNDIALYVNGTQIGTDTNANTPTGLDRIDFTNGNLGSGFYFSGKLKQLQYFNEALTDSELETITSYDSFGQMAKALLYTIE
jgi:hypothetical protein